MDYSKELLERIWKKGIAIDGYDPNLIRKDACGAWILRDAYGSEDSDYGWEVDHICPREFLSQKEGVDVSHFEDEINLRPLNRKNFLSKSNSYPNYKAVTVAKGDINVDCEKLFSVNNKTQASLASLFGFAE